jgi:hypothetical protein
LDVAGDVMTAIQSFLSPEQLLIGLTAIGEDLTKGEALIREICDVVPTLAFEVVWESLEHFME